MDESMLNDFKESLATGFIDKEILSDAMYLPAILVNSKDKNQKVLSTIIKELEQCLEFSISVAFVTTSGVATLINHLDLLCAKGIKGKILVSQYLNFTQPEALRRILQFPNIELKIATEGNFHSKGYFFKNKEYYNLVIGSSNLTASALCTNIEWNLKVSALHQSKIVEKVLHEFEEEFKRAIPVTPDFILAYQEIYNSQRIIDRKKSNDSNIQFSRRVIPNSMQIEALKNLANLRQENKNKALLISATGTGKTYLSAFDAQAFNPSKLLFVVHRLNIAQAAMNTFRSIFGSAKSMGLYSGNQKELEKDFIFSTIQTISKPDHLKQFKKQEFDYIIIDESHRSGAHSYLRLLEYFKPQFLLGMTATPERTDGNDIFKLFNHNIAYEIRLNRAMEEEMLSPFHYYGVTDISVNGEVLESDSDFLLLTSEERVDRIIEKSKFYGCDNGIIRGLIFCSRKRECIELSNKFNSRGFRTIALTGDNTEEQRAKAIEQLESENLNKKLDYIFTVDIFNEGIDIPKLNQVIMMRPTQSQIVFVQQLGRGLRKANNKDYLTVIDFIGNYKNSYLIPIALFGDTSYNKDSLRKLVSLGSKMIPGSSTINFDPITKEKIFESIDSANMKLLVDLKKDYNLLKFKLGRTPMMVDFMTHGSRDPYLFVDYSGSYLNFVLKCDPSFNCNLNKKEKKLLELFSKEINNSKRVEESYILKQLIETGTLTSSKLKKEILNIFGYTLSDDTINSSINNLNFHFIRDKKDGKLVPISEIYNFQVINFKDDTFSFHPDFLTLVKNQEFKKFLIDNINYSINTFTNLFDQKNWQYGFILYRKYSRKDVFRILNVKENPVAQNVGGYLVHPDNKHCPIFVNYHKEDNISASINYKDEFVNSKEFDWMSKSNRTLKSKDVQAILNSNNTMRLPLFIKKSNDEGRDFYYMGNITPQPKKAKQTFMKDDKGKSISVVQIRFNMETPVTDSIYTYLKDKHEKNTLPKISPEKPKLEILSIEKVNPFINSVPLYHLFAAAGDFSELQSDPNKEWVKIPQRFKPRKDLFVCKVIGESMNKIIPNGAYCLFKQYTGGSRNGEIVLVQNYNKQDPDFRSSYTVKKYFSTKQTDVDLWRHQSITLKPYSFDPKFQPIILQDDAIEHLNVCGIFVAVLT